jgi:NadR type nicotinamide-nucleotide adenylyltransferase
MTSAKRFGTGLVIGKFYPPHAGHHHLVEIALAQADRVFVIVCHHPRQTIAGEVRAACLRDVHPTAQVILVDDDLRDDDSAAWAEKTRTTLGFAPDAVFTSEDYGTAYAGCLGSGTVHVLVDRERRAVPCSGTMIRAAPLEHLRFLSPFMRAWYVKRICVLGAESTGTTTLACALAAHYETAWVPEYGREYCERHWHEGYAWRTEEFTHIATEQARREDVAAREANRVLICDTDPLATSVWHERYLRQPSPEVLAIARARRYDLYILTGDDIPFTQDGWRDGEHIRHAMHERFAEILAGWGTPWFEVRGSRADRLAAAVARVDAGLAPPGGLSRPETAGV